jgi:hypothetical protein
VQPLLLKSTPHALHLRPPPHRRRFSPAMTAPTEKQIDEKKEPKSKTKKKRHRKGKTDSL